MSRSSNPCSPLKELDAGIRKWVGILRDNGVETTESCEGGRGHPFPAPTIRFCGGYSAGFAALAIAQTFAMPVFELRRVWMIQGHEPVGPHWELVFIRKDERK